MCIFVSRTKPRKPAISGDPHPATTPAGFGRESERPGSALSAWQAAWRSPREHLDGLRVRPPHLRAVLCQAPMELELGAPWELGRDYAHGNRRHASPRRAFSRGPPRTGSECTIRDRLMFDDAHAHVVRSWGLYYGMRSHVSSDSNSNSGWRCVTRRLLAQRGFTSRDRVCVSRLASAAPEPASCAAKPTPSPCCGRSGSRSCLACRTGRSRRRCEPCRLPWHRRVSTSQSQRA